MPGPLAKGGRSQIFRAGGGGLEVPPRRDRIPPGYSGASAGEAHIRFFSVLRAGLAGTESASLSPTAFSAGRRTVRRALPSGAGPRAGATRPASKEPSGLTSRREASGGFRSMALDKPSSTSLFLSLSKEPAPKPMAARMSLHCRPGPSGFGSLDSSALANRAVLPSLFRVFVTLSSSTLSSGAKETTRRAAIKNGLLTAARDHASKSIKSHVTMRQSFGGNYFPRREPENI